MDFHSTSFSSYFSAKGVWFSGRIPNFAFMTWLAMHDRLATWDRILKWNPQAVTKCWLCKSETESKNNLYFTCPYTHPVWRGLVGNLLGSRYSNRWKQNQQILGEDTRDATTMFLVQYAFQMVVYMITWCGKKCSKSV